MFNEVCAMGNASNVRSMKVERDLQSYLPRVVSGVGQPEELRRLNPDEVFEVHAVEQVGRVGGDLDSEELSVASLTPVTERFGQTQIHAREVRPALRVAPRALRTVVHHRIAVVVEAGRDVIRATGGVIDDRRYLETVRQSEQRGGEELMSHIASRKPALGR